MDQGVSITPLHALGAYALFSIALFVWLGLHRRPPKTIVGYWLLFSWFCFVQAVLVWLTDLIPAATDGITYFNNAREIASHGFDPQIVAEHLKSGINNWGVNVYTLLEAGLIYLTMPSFALVHIANIFLGTMAVYYASRFASIVLGPHVQKYVILGFLVYFAWYWNVLQNLREAPLLCALGIALVYFAKWSVAAQLKHGIAAVIFGLIAVLFRAQNILLLMAVGGLAVVYRHGSLLKRYWKTLILLPPLMLLAIDLGFRLAYDAPLRMINNARASRMEAGHHLDLPVVSSVWDVIPQIPETLRYFFVPILPWQVNDGLLYFKAYVHSSIAFVIVGFAVIGILRMVATNGLVAGQRRTLGVLSVGFTAVAVLYSVIDVGAGVASRHSTFIFYFLLSSLVPMGLVSVRNLGARAVYGEAVRRKESGFASSPTSRAPI